MILTILTALLSFPAAVVLPHLFFLIGCMNAARQCGYRIKLQKGRRKVFDLLGARFTDMSGTMYRWEEIEELTINSYYIDAMVRGGSTMQLFSTVVILLLTLPLTGVLPILFASSYSLVTCAHFALITTHAKADWLRKNTVVSD